VVFNFRHGTVTTAQALRGHTEAVLVRHGLRFDLRWHESGAPFLSPPDGRLRAAVREAAL